MNQFKHVVAKDALELIEKGAIVADIRDGQNFANNHIKGAVNLSNDNLQEFIDSNEFDAPILVCCYHGMSSQSAAAFLCERGFEEVYSIDGGFERWVLAFSEHCEKG
ncbi:MAG: thiosulfate sulfurtransferase GlpE [Marinobacterium sp.]